MAELYEHIARTPTWQLAVWCYFIVTSLIFITEAWGEEPLTLEEGLEILAWPAVMVTCVLGITIGVPMAFIGSAALHLSTAVMRIYAKLS